MTTVCKRCDWTDEEIEPKWNFVYCPLCKSDIEAELNDRRLKEDAEREYAEGRR